MSNQFTLGGFRIDRVEEMSATAPSVVVVPVAHRGAVIVWLPAPHVAEPQPIGKLLSNLGVTIQQQCLTSHIAPCRMAEIDGHVNTDVAPDSEINRKSGGPCRTHPRLNVRVTAT